MKTPENLHPIQWWIRYGNYLINPSKFLAFFIRENTLIGVDDNNNELALISEIPEEDQRNALDFLAMKLDSN